MFMMVLLAFYSLPLPPRNPTDAPATPCPTSIISTLFPLLVPPLARSFPTTLFLTSVHSTMYVSHRIPVSREETFTNLKMWMEEVTRKYNEVQTTNTVIVGNKCDLPAKVPLDVVQVRPLVFSPRPFLSLALALSPPPSFLSGTPSACVPCVPLSRSRIILAPHSHA
jgi:hypothetical protein